MEKSLLFNLNKVHRYTTNQNHERASSEQHSTFPPLEIFKRPFIKLCHLKVIDIQKMHHEVKVHRIIHTETLIKYVAPATTVASCGTAAVRFVLRSTSPSVSLPPLPWQRTHRLTKMRGCTQRQRLGSWETEARLAQASPSNAARAHTY